MIVGKQKPLEEIWSMIAGHQKIVVFGCNTCVAVCHQGGNKEAEILASLLRLKAKQAGQDMEVTHAGIERQCEHEFFESAEAQILAVEAVVSIACGVGVQFTAEKYSAVKVYPGLDTCFMGAVVEQGHWAERCQGCGQCILDRTAGICPISRCAKRILNGPCGGSTNGKCEISKETDCAWQLIYDRLESMGRSDDFESLAAIKDWSTERAGGPRKLILEDEQP